MSATNLFQDKKTGLWYMRATIDGKRITRACGTRRKTEANNRLQEWHTDIRRGKWGLDQMEKKIPFSELVNRYLSWSETNHKSHESTEGYCRNLMKAFGKDIHIQKISTWDVEKYISARRKNVKPATVNRDISCLKHMFSKANEWELTKHNPTTKIKKLPEENERIRYLEPEERARLLEACAAGPDYLLPIFQIGINAGLRRGEILNLEWRDIDLHNKMIRVSKSKSGKPRDVPMNDILFKMFRVMERTVEKVFPVTEFKRSWETAKRRADISDFRFHDTRHEFASQLVMAGVHLSTVKELCGHHDVRVTMRYAHLSPGHMRDAVQKLVELQKAPVDTNKNKVVQIA